MAVGAVAAGVALGGSPGRDVSAALTAVATFAALAVSVARRKAGVAGERARKERVAARISGASSVLGTEMRAGNAFAFPEAEGAVPEFPPGLDLIAPIVGAVGLVFAGVHAGGGHDVLSVARTLAGAAFLGSISDAMLLGHWYLVQPGLARGPLLDLVRWVGIVWPFEIALLLWPVGMVSVLNGSIDDGYGGILGWFWLACAITTIGLVIVTRAALRERAYSAVMAATGLLYLAILTAFGTDLVARAVLA